HRAETMQCRRMIESNNFWGSSMEGGIGDCAAFFMPWHVASLAVMLLQSSLAEQKKGGVREKAGHDGNMVRKRWEHSRVIVGKGQVVMIAGDDTPLHFFQVPIPFGYCAMRGHRHIPLLLRNFARSVSFAGSVSPIFYLPRLLSSCLLLLSGLLHFTLKLPRSDAIMSAYLLAGTSALKTNCIVKVSRPCLRERKAVA